MTNMLMKDTNREPFGHLRLDIYEGELEFAPIKGLDRRPDGTFLMFNLPNAFDLAKIADRTERESLRRIHPRGYILNPLLDVQEGDNLITTTGKEIILDRTYGLSAIGAITQHGVGTSNTAAAVGDTTLTGLVLLPLDATATRAGLVVTSVATAGTGTANITWAEFGAFNATPKMLDRIAPIGPFTKTSATSIVTTLQVTQA